MSVSSLEHSKALEKIESLEQIIRSQKEDISKLEKLVSQLRLGKGVGQGGANGGASASESSDWDRLAAEERERRRKNLSRKSAKARSSRTYSQKSSATQSTGTPSGGATPGSGDEDSWSETGSEGSYSVSEESSWDSDTVPYSTKSTSSPSPPRSPPVPRPGTVPNAATAAPPPAPISDLPKPQPLSPVLTEEEIVDRVKAWARGKNVVDMIRSLKDVYHGSNLVQLDAKYIDPTRTLSAKECRVAFLRTCKSIHPDKQAHECETVKIEAKVIFEALHDKYELYK